MTLARRHAVPLGVLVVLAVASVVLALGRRETPAQARPTLLLLTSLPLLFGDDFSLQQNGSPALKALEADYRVVPISTTAAPELRKGGLMLMAQPLGQAPEDLVALDAWVRKGGRVLLHADPLLEWPSKRPLGDALRPPPTFVDTGLLDHWGLRLDAPDEPGPARRVLGEGTVETRSPGTLSGKCPITADRLVAGCVLGKGRATVVADADFLDVGDLGAEAAPNLDAMTAELAMLRRR